MFRFLRSLFVALLLAALVAGAWRLYQSPNGSYTVREWFSGGGYHAQDALIVEAAGRENLDPMLVKAIVWRESRFRPDMVVAADLADYLRGRAPGEVPALIARECIENGIEAQSFKTAGSPGDGMGMILDDLQHGDVALILALSDRDRVFDLIRTAQKLD